jgi:predicted phage terminase large subunit-like protein
VAKLPVYSTSGMRQTVIDDLAHRYSNSLPDFIRGAWHLVEPSTPLSWNWHLDEICDVLQAISRGEKKRVVINLPPGCAKSLTISVFFPSWEWARRPELRYLTFSYSDANTIRDNLRVRDICASKWYRELFWEHRSRGKSPVRFSDDQNVKVRFNTTEKGWRIASSVDGKGTGEHPDRIILDDLLKAQDAKSDTRVEAANNWLQGTMSTRVARKPAIILIMQRLAENDPTRFLLDKGGWEHILFPMHYHIPYLEIQSDGQQKWVNGFDCNCHRDKPDPRDHRTMEGELLWPDKFTEEQVREMEIDLGPIEAEGQLEGRPNPPGGTLLKREDFQIVPCIPPADLRKFGRKSCRGWDTADTDMESKAAKRSDWTVGVKMSQVGTRFYIEHVKRAKLESDKVDELILQLAEEDGRSCKIREGEGSGKATIKARGTSLAGYDYAPAPEKESKEMRGTPFRREVQRGNVYLIAADWNSAYLDVVCGFPVAKNDDDWDASANAYNGLVEDAPVPRGRRAGWAYPANQ